MHRLVQLSAKARLDVQKSTTKWRLEALSILAKLFPSGKYRTWRTCEALSPHGRVISQHKIPPDDYCIEHELLLHKMAGFYLYQGRLQRPFSGAQEALNMFEHICGSESPEALLTMTTVGTVSSSRPTTTRLKNCSEEIALFMNRSLGPLTPKLSEVWALSP